jgi:hypothetical protein
MAIETETEMLVRATLEHRIVRFRYRGMSRTVEPHLVGNHEAGETLLVGYQTAGESGSGELPGWRTFVTSEVEAVEVVGRHLRDAAGRLRPADASDGGDLRPRLAHTVARVRSIVPRALSAACAPARRAIGIR